MVRRSAPASSMRAEESHLSSPCSTTEAKACPRAVPYGATAQNLKRLVRFLATMPPAKDKLRNQIRSRSLRLLEAVHYQSRTFSRRRTLFQQLQLGGHLLRIIALSKRTFERLHSRPTRVPASSVTLKTTSGWPVFLTEVARPLPDDDKWLVECTGPVATFCQPSSSSVDATSPASSEAAVTVIP